MKPKHDELGQQLRTAATDTAPAFSDELHTRVMAGLRRARAADLPPRPWQVDWRWPVATALAAGIAAVLLIRPSPVTPTAPPPITRNTQQVRLSDVASLGAAVIDAAGPAREKLKEARFAYLDRDGKRLAMFLWHSVPVVPVDHHDPDPS